MTTETVPTPEPTLATPPYRKLGALVMSVPCDQVSAALAEAQGQMGRVVADKQAGGGKRVYTYADLAAVLGAAKEALHKAGVSIIQAPTVTERGRVAVTTTLLHSSGQYIANTLSAPAGGDVQAIGSAITYVRRYAATALLGLAPEDDDGQASVSQTRGQQQRRQPPPQQRQQRQQGPPPQQRQQQPPKETPVRRLQKLWHVRLGEVRKGLSDEHRRQLQEHLWGVESSSQLLPRDAIHLHTKLQATTNEALAQIVAAIIDGEGQCPHCLAKEQQQS